ncbi:MAG TPA: aldo/keto reductase [Kiritimatiellia bacterium]|nr:aldo/keto reductase [Kiritimatiellia bacterium]
MKRSATPQPAPPPRPALGCMRIAELAPDQLHHLLTTAIELGIQLFDHADIYANGESERRFGQAIRDLGMERTTLFLQSKCGIRNGTFDFSRDHILASVDASLARLQTDYLDQLLLHRPDALVEPDEVAAAFDHLARTGKVKTFGVSNMNPWQIQVLQSRLSRPLQAVQIQMSLGHCPAIDHGFNANMISEAATQRDGGILEYSRLHGLNIQAWSPLQFGYFKGTFIDHPDYGHLNHVLRQVAGQHGISPSAVAIAWLLRHPAGIQPILGTTRPERLRELFQATTMTMTRDTWYELYRASGKILP